MDNYNKIDPYEAIIGMNWKPKSGEIKKEAIPSGTKVQVVQKGALVTDNQGRLLVRKPEDIQIFSNLLNHAWEIWIIPELKRRRDAQLPAPFPLMKFIVLFDKERNIPTIKFNEEYEFKVPIRIKRGLKINKGDPIIFDQIVDIGPFETPLKDGKPVAFFIFGLNVRQISVYFDFRPNDPKFKIDEWKDEGKWLSEAYLETLLAGIFGHSSLIIPQLSRNDIPFTIGLKSERIKALCDIIEKGLEKKLDDALSKIKQSEVESLIDGWLTLDLFSKRANILREVLKSFKNEIYGAVILLLMSQIEGIITEELIANKKGLNKDGTAKQWNIRMNEFYEVVKMEEIGSLISRILDGAHYFLKNSNIYKKFTWTSMDNSVNRHACLHGKDVSFNTCANAIRMILLFDALYWIFFAISLSRMEKKENSMI